MPAAGHPITLGISLKMYFDHERTLSWCRGVAEIARAHDAVRSGRATLFAMPSFVSISDARDILNGAAEVGAQDIAADDAGAFTGEVSGPQLVQVGCRYAEIGHAERRTLFGETDDLVARKLAAAVRNGITPVLCIGEEQQLTPAAAAEACAEQIASASARLDDSATRMIVAYEPQWAIGQAEPAPTDYVREVAQRLRGTLDASGRESSSILYGGSAGPGLITEIADSVDGLFLGRFAHDPLALRQILDEVDALA
ncbi:triose-phosphate isomerase family protein [Paramicrobacterium agarici]|uniref:triose-phosphate isomerase family protein n=1 Tax=Paramicrobacterium agarici TaxID=630514 RepID=UPI0011529AE1|nr:triose-phosphate isomerase family protein [Microbacterium agarici]TQO21868.1 triosephosphate isomerase [Microbacterium agarici]